MLITLKSLFSSLVCTGHWTERNTSTMFAFISSLVTVNCFFSDMFPTQSCEENIFGQPTWAPGFVAPSPALQGQ